MKEKVVVRLLSLAALGTVALWPAANSEAWDWCPVQSCDFWQNVCQTGGGDWDLDDIGICIKEDNNMTEAFHATCTPPNPAQAPWSVDCVPD
jgi:hypothetical protein